VGELRPGMSARATILTAEVKDVLRVPLQSVLERDGSIEEAQKKGLFAPEVKSVVMAVKNGKAVETVVSVGIANTQYFEMKSGVGEGETLLTGPVRMMKELKNNDTVKLRQKSDSQLEHESKQKQGKKA